MDEHEAGGAIRVCDTRTGQPYSVSSGTEVVLASRACRVWRSPLLFEVHRKPRGEFREHTTINHQLMINLGSPVRLGWLEGDRRCESMLGPEHLCIQSDGDSNATRWNAEYAFATAAISPGLIDTILGDLAPPSAELFPKRHCAPAAVAASYARAFAGELAAPTEPLYSETLAAAFVLHLLAVYGKTAGRKQLAPKGRLGAAQLRAVAEFVHEHLARGITLESMANVVHHSSFQFARLFKATTGRAPHQYVLSLRLERARRLLGRGESLATVARTSGFYDQAHLTNAFRKAHGVTPAAYVSQARPS